MKHIRSVFIGGKQIGVNALRILVAENIPPEFVVANLDDEGVDSWHESLVRVAREHDITVITGKKVRDEEVVSMIRDAKPDHIFCIGGMQIIPKEVLDIPTLGTFNIHPALLPKYRGRFSTVHALFNNEKETGATLHFMDEGLDSGPIVAQERFPITETDTGRTLYDKFTQAGTTLFTALVADLVAGKKIVSTPQNESEATYYPKGLPGDGKIDWNWDGKTIERFIRAMTFEPFPPADFTIGDKHMLIVDEKYFSGFKQENGDSRNPNEGK
jgi:UDP-4-amino-4-deoxy-L-arabinose formyltransferase/UDP-glucuronic acid dehydrogenase (UDP-4-keto-hexauronic acid decarboxylating)